jgi:hypothetical protein
MSSVPEALLEAAEAGVGHHVDHRGEDGVDADGGGLVVKGKGDERGRRRRVPLLRKKRKESPVIAQACSRECEGCATMRK